MPDEIAAAGREVVEMLGACAAAPDDLETGRAADEALMRLEQVLAASSTETGDGAERQAATAGSSLSQKGIQLVTTRVPVPASQELLEELRRICAETVEIPIGKITAEADLAADLGVDSLSHGELVVKALERYGLSAMASTVQPASYPTLRALADLIQQLTGEKSSGPG